MALLPKISIGPVNCSPHTMVQLVDDLRHLVANEFEQPRTILCTNAHIYNLAVTDAALRKSLNDARINAADGKAICWAARMCGGDIPERCNMTEAFRAFLQDSRMPKTTAILVGMTEAECETAARTINAAQPHCKVISTNSGFLDDAAYTKIFQQHSSVDFIFLGMGTPRTELTAQLAASVCPNAIVWGIGAGTIRIYAGTMKEAPTWMRRIGLQWLHRLFSDPRNLWKRYIIGNPRFVFHILRARFGKNN
jgi:N-acetylglucosaminyldiphosphoundecaprenol N-acetyl-beta-D-mannosaminyltransferase